MFIPITKIAMRSRLIQHPLTHPKTKFPCNMTRSLPKYNNPNKSKYLSLKKHRVTNTQTILLHTCFGISYPGVWAHLEGGVVQGLVRVCWADILSSEPRPWRVFGQLVRAMTRCLATSRFLPQRHYVKNKSRTEILSSYLELNNHGMKIETRWCEKARTWIS